MLQNESLSEYGDWGTLGGLLVLGVLLPYCVTKSSSYSSWKCPSADNSDISALEIRPGDVHELQYRV